MSRFDFVKFSDTAQAHDACISLRARQLEEEIEKLLNGREKSLALTKLEEAVMWARKALRDVP